MNKKRLSVVMAGAMLASSVAPVLAAETSVNEVSQGRIGLLIDRLETLMNSKKFDENDRTSKGAKSEFAGKSVYAVEILKDGKTPETLTAQADITTLKISDKKTVNLYSNEAFEAALKELTTKDFSTAGVNFYTVKVYELGNTTDKDGRIVSTTTSNGESKVENYDATTFAPLLTAAKEVESTGTSSSSSEIATAITNGWIVGAKVSEDEKEVTIELGSKENDKFNEIKCAVGTPRLNFDVPVDKFGKSLVGKDDEYIQANIAGFEISTSGTVAPGTIIDIAGENAKVAHEVKVVNGDINYTVKVDDLYDGFMLTEKGHELMNAVRTSKNEVYAPVAGNYTFVENGTERSFTITFVDANKTKHVVKVVGDSLHEGRIETLKKWLEKGKADVELLAGDNRYATAVEIAKTYIAKQYESNVGTGEKLNATDELILINGKALVDGLAAAPYARQQNAPILLTATDSLPKETKAYMKELIANYKVENLNNKTITVTIVGGEAVVSQNVVDELKEIGFKVKRLSGDNREETSLAVAHKITSDKNKDNKAYLVGANGEADAMSIAAYAAKSNRPIIVAASAKKGLSTDGLNEVSEYDFVEIVGGEGVVPKSTEEALKELVKKDYRVTRINGKNRQETNALVIKKYHKGFKDALIAKDGQRNKEELVDALPASLFASAVYGVESGSTVAAPIVLATDKISDEQINQLVLNADKSNGKTVYQIGHGVAKSVMETVVTKLNLNK